MTKRRRHDRRNTVHLYRRLQAGRAGARPSGTNLRQSCLRDRRANRACGSASASIPRLVIDDRGCGDAGRPRHTRADFLKARAGAAVRVGIDDQLVPSGGRHWRQEGQLSEEFCHASGPLRSKSATSGTSRHHHQRRPRHPIVESLISSRKPVQGGGSLNDLGRSRRQTRLHSTHRRLRTRLQPYRRAHRG